MTTFPPRNLTKSLIVPDKELYIFHMQYHRFWWLCDASYWLVHPRYSGFNTAEVDSQTVWINMSRCTTECLFKLWSHKFMFRKYGHLLWHYRNSKKTHAIIRCSMLPTRTWWRHQMKTFSALLAICAGNSSVAGEFHAQRPMTRSFDVFFDLRLNKRLSKQSWACDLRRHRAHYDVIVMESPCLCVRDLH